MEIAKIVAYATEEKHENEDYLGDEGTYRNGKPRPTRLWRLVSYFGRPHVVRVCWVLSGLYDHALTDGVEADSTPTQAPRVPIGARSLAFGHCYFIHT